MEHEEINSQDYFRPIEEAPAYPFEYGHENVSETSEIIEHTPMPADDGHHHGPFYIQPEFWVAMSFVLVVALLFIPIKRIGKALILKRIDNIIKRIDDAANIKKDAQKLLAEYEKKLNAANDDVAEIVAKSEKQISQIRQESVEKLEQEARIKEKDALDRINTAKENASKEIINQTSDLSIKALKLVLSKKLGNKEKGSLIDDSIHDIPRYIKAK